MKSMTSHDGVMHGNVQTVGRYDESKGHKKQVAHETGGESGGEHEPSGHDEIKQVVADHGAAHHIEMHHDHEAGEHHVTSHHEDGYVHKETLGTPAMAHAHAAHAGGVSDSGELHEAHMGQQEADTLDEAAHRSGIEKSKHSAKAGGGFMPEHGIGAEG